MDVSRDFEKGFGKGRVVEVEDHREDGAGGLGRVVGAKSIKPRRTEWLWPGWIPLGGLTFLTGDAGVGKGLYEADLIARLGKARKFPDGSKAPRITTLIYSQEENRETTLIPRLKAAGADLDRVRLALPEAPRNGARAQPLKPLPGGIEHVRRFVAQTGAGLVIFDPIFQFFAHGADTNSETAVYEALAPLIEFAQEQNLAVLCVRHPNKRVEMSGIYRMMGSGAFGQLPRTIIGVKQMAGDEHGRLVLCEKNNLMAKPSALPFRIVEGRGKVARIEWGQPLDREAEEAATAASEVTPNKLQRARELVKKMLADEGTEATTLIKTAASLGISAATMHRAYREEKVQSEPLKDEKSGLMKGMLLWLPK